MDSFWALSTERYMGWVPGYIPQHRVDERGERLGLSPGMMALFSAAVRACDDEYLSRLTRKRSGKSST